MLITGKELQRLAYKLCYEFEEEDNLELLNRVALFLFYESYKLGVEVSTDTWKVVDGVPILFFRLPKYAEHRRCLIQDWHWYLIKDKYDKYLERVKYFLYISEYYPSDKLQRVTATIAEDTILKQKEVKEISFYALAI